jgi:anti-sigma factor (TIGR02949 family)
MTDHNHKTLSCDQLLGMLTDYLDGQAREELCHEIEAHIAGCNNCKVVVDTTKKTISLAHACNDKPLNLPADVRERLFKRLNLDDHLNS